MMLVYCVHFSCHAVRMRELNSDGSIKDVCKLLASYGFNIGDTVERKSDKSVGEILSVDDGKVKLKISGDVVAVVPVEAFMKRQWHVAANKNAPVEIKPTMHIQQCQRFINNRIAAFISLELADLAAQHEHFLEDVEIHIKPKRGVKVTKPYAKGKLLIVPVCLKVIVGDKPPKSVIMVGVATVGSKFWLSPLPTPKQADDIAAPFWFIGQDVENHNMEMFNVKASSNPQFVEFHVQIPIARNSKALKAGDWLMFPKIQSDEPVEPLHIVEGPTKRPKRKS
jgi:hypothetical protein